MTDIKDLNLPDLGYTPDPITLAKLKALWNNYPLAPNLSLQKGDLVFQPDDTLRLYAGRSGAGLRGKVSQVILDSLIKPNHWNVDGSVPLFGGNLGLHIGNDNGIRSYGIQYSHNF